MMVADWFLTFNTQISGDIHSQDCHTLQQHTISNVLNSRTEVQPAAW
jgi:hypothetical protein